MNQHRHDPLQRNRVDATLDSMSIGGSSGSPLPEINPRVALVEGSGPGLSGETRLLLRTRLRAAAVVLCLGSAAFLLRTIVSGGMLDGDSPLGPNETFLNWFHVVHVAVLALVSYKLCWRCNLSLRALRAAELVIFGLTGLFFACVQHFANRVSISVDHVAYNPVGIWFCLMFTYAIYIPNTWRRAAVVIGCMAVAPVAVIMLDDRIYGGLSTGEHLNLLSYVILFMAAGFGSSVYGTYMIGSLRQEAFEAKQLGQYRLRHLIGSGGMGEVYLAEHQLMKRPCAIKIIRPGKAAIRGRWRASSARCGPRPRSRIGTRSRFSITAAPRTARSIT